MLAWLRAQVLRPPQKALQTEALPVVPCEPVPARAARRRSCPLSGPASSEPDFLATRAGVEQFENLLVTPSGPIVVEAHSNGVL